MPRLTIVSRERHDQKKWRRYESYAFAAADALVPVVGAELANTALLMPLAFSEQSGRYTLVAILSLAPGRNMFVGADGRWLSPYVPSAFRGYPFRLLPQQGTDKIVLCVDEESGLVVERSSPGEDFFDAEGNLSPALKPVFEFLRTIENSRQITDMAVAALAEAGIIRPWQLAVKTEQGQQTISGLHRIDEVAMNALPDDVFLNLRKRSALPIVYAQMLSARQLGIFEHLARLHNQPAPPPLAKLPETIDSLFEMPGAEAIRFK
jgi:hypothetical protein